MSKVWKSPDLEPPVRAFRTVLALAQRLRYQMDDRLRADGLTTQQAALLTVVIAMGQPSATEAADALGSTHQNVAQLVAALQRKGFLDVRADPNDRRRKLLTATPASDAYWTARDQGDIAALTSWFAVLSPSEVDTLCALADRVLEGLQKNFTGT
jgi:DNA-binding MarR family transcriptional regulator